MTEPDRVTVTPTAESSNPETTGDRTVSPWRRSPLVTLLATGMGSGMIRPYSGSWGTIPAVLLGWGLLRLENPWPFAVGTVAMILLSIWVSGRAEPLFGHDSNRIVIDEFAGAFVALIALPTHWHVMIPVFVLFRILDVVKPWPCRRFERLPGGWGVTMDDVMAGIYTNIAVRVLIFFQPEWFGV
ncbi:MAG TPA: phosphatidylglycerophosphatase A [Acidobacteriota bacterium]|nr:phosphatidylglycerophosphatase A [Acidobacteriota bacterium]